MHSGAAPAISVTDVFTIGLGPSSSHTVGPMRAACAFAEEVAGAKAQPIRATCALYGSLALTGPGHATDRALMLGLMGWLPDGVDPDRIESCLATVASEKGLLLAGVCPIPFDPNVDIRWFTGIYLDSHPNGIKLHAELADGTTLERTFYSIGGGAIRRDGQEIEQRQVVLCHPFQSAAELLQICSQHGLNIADVVRRNEEAWRPARDTDAFLLNVRSAMSHCIDRGLAASGLLPGVLKLPRRASAMHRSLLAKNRRCDPSAVFAWVSLWALAVNEENAAGGRVVIAPTCGAAGVIPAVIRYYETFVSDEPDDGVLRLLYTAAAIGSLYKHGASISAAEMGCQGEVGVACSMAAAGLAAALGGSPSQIENAAEIGMEHNLGLTCDPIAGLVQIPCIERNAMGAIQAINAAYLALGGNGEHFVSLDAVIATMRQTGEDMKHEYKETSLGGLAVNVVEC